MKTLYNRHKRWSEKSVWRSAFEELVATGGLLAEALIESTHLKTQRF